MSPNPTRLFDSAQSSNITLDTDAHPMASMAPAPAHASISPAFSFHPVQTPRGRSHPGGASSFGNSLLPNWLVPQTLMTHVLCADAGEAKAQDRCESGGSGAQSLSRASNETPRSLDSPKSWTPVCPPHPLEPKHSEQASWTFRRSYQQTWFLCLDFLTCSSGPILALLTPPLKKPSPS